MSFAARKAGAVGVHSALLCTVSLVMVALAAPLDAATPQLLRVQRAEVSGTVTPQSAAASVTGMRLRLHWDEGSEELQLRRNSSLGVLADRLQGSAVAYTGTLAGRPGSWVALTRIGTRWTGLWFDGTHYFGVDDARSLSKFSPAAAREAAERTLVFRLSDLKVEDASFEGDTRQIDAAALAADLTAGLAQSASAQVPATAEAVLPFKRLSIALIGDAELSLQDGAQTEANMLARLNIVDAIFASQLGVHLQAGSVTVLSGVNAPPATTVPGDLLAWLRDYRAASTQQRASGLSHLMTGRDLDARTVGIAYIQGLCSASFSSSVAQTTGSIQIGALIAAHEIGHVFGAPHDAEPSTACAATPPTYLMSAQINDSSIFSACSLEQMTPALTRSCLAPYDAPDASVEAPQNVSIAIGQPSDITVTVRSVGRADVTNISLRVTLPPGGSVISVGSNAGECAITGLTVDCALGAMAAGVQVNVVLRVQYDTAVTGVAQLRLMADNDGLSSNDRTTFRLESAPGADLALSPQSATLAATTGEDITVTLTLQNKGAAAVTDARLTVQVPAGLALLQQIPEELVCVPVTDGLTCGPQPLAAGASVRVTLTLRAAVPATYVLAAQGSASAPDPAGSNNQVLLQYNVSATPVSPGSSAASGGGGGRWSGITLAALAALTLLAALRRQRVAAVK